MTARRSAADIGFAMCIVALGCYVIYAGTQLPVGTIRRIGPGFFPIGIGALIAVLGVVCVFDRPSGAARDDFNLYGLAFVSLAILAFALLVGSAGLFPATAAAVLLTNVAGKERVSPLAVLGTIAGLCATGYVVFIYALRLPVDPFAAGLIPGG
ncbi:tripartite tricarboxylate transporter TctB family protein [Microbaculum marinum]|uniref:Tripartite tricarboxylate transporter TctB family protein n=1 Tax=Microbaculum marinum TaxID=1764581 RepID=A0AAW9RWQ4_9HYPH